MTTIDLSGQQLEVKRLNFDDGKIYIKCPACEEKGSVNFGSDVLYYPEVGKSEDIYFYCRHCHSEFESVGKYKLNVSIDVEINQ